jgi:hypothetical protein
LLESFGITLGYTLALLLACLNRVVGELVEKRLIIFTQSLPDKKKALPLHSQTTKRAARE